MNNDSNTKHSAASCDADEHGYKYNLESLKIDFNITILFLHQITKLYCGFQYSKISCHI